MRITFKVLADSQVIDKILDDINVLDEIGTVSILEKTEVNQGFLDRTANNQLDIQEFLIGVAVGKGLDEVYDFTKAKIVKIIQSRKGRLIEQDENRTKNNDHK